MQPKLGRADKAAQAGDLGAGNNVSAQALAQKVHPSLNRANFGQVVHCQLDALMGMFFVQRTHQGTATHRAQHSLDHATVQAAILEMSRQFGLHLETQHQLRRHCLQRQAQDLAKAEAVLDLVSQRSIKPGLLVSAPAR